MGQQTSSTLMVQALRKGCLDHAGILLGPSLRSHKPCSSSVWSHAAQSWGEARAKSPGSGTFCNAQQPLVSPMLPWQRPAAPLSAVPGAGVLLSAGWACPWLCDPNNKQQQVESGVAQFCLVPVRARDKTQCNCVLTKGRLRKGSISTDSVLQ